MKNAKCPSCGANIEIDETKDAGVCKYCGNAFTTEKALSMITNTTTNNNNASTINNYYSAPTPAQPQPANMRVARKPRPQLKIGLAILGLICYVIPGILYIAYIKQKQKEWDNKYTY